MRIFLRISVLLFFLFYVNFSLASTTSDPDLQTARVVEKNGIADALCRAIKIGTGEAGKAIFAFILLATGLGVLQGKIQAGLFIGLTLGISCFFAAEHVVGFLTSDGSSKGGCECREYLRAGEFKDAKGNVYYLSQDIKLNRNCTEKP